MTIKAKIIRVVLAWFFPRYFSGQLITEFGLFRLRLFHARTRKRYKGQKNLLVNLGAGESSFEGWVNVDAFYHPGINCLWDCRQSLPFGDASVKFIFTEHFFEHIDYRHEAPYLLKDALRVLEPGGTIRIIVPDAEKYIHAYLSPGWEEISRVRPLKENQVDYYSGEKINTKMELINWVFRQEYQHKFAYDFDTLKYLLEQAGFKNITKQDFGKSGKEGWMKDMPIRASESLYVEASK